MQILNQILEQIESLEREHPYKIQGSPNTYGPYNEAWQDCCDRAEGIVRKHMDDSSSITVVEYCPHCENEVELCWNVEEDGYQIFCPNCGKVIMLCSMCDARDGAVCDWSENGCKHSDERYAKVNNSSYISINDERLWQILFDEACVEGEQEKRIYDELKEICMGDIWRNMNDSWIPVYESLPENAKQKGALCPKYHVMTKYGETVGWYNPDYESWFILLWFMTERFDEINIDLERGSIPKVARIPYRSGVVKAWKNTTLEVQKGENI